MAKLPVEIKLSELNEMKTMFELISDNFDCIKDPLRSRFLEWVESKDKAWVSWSDIAPEFINNKNCSVLVDGKDHVNVTGYNKILRKVKVLNKDPNRIEIINAKSFSINNIGFDNFVEWS